MVKLTDYLYNGDTVIQILHKYFNDLNKSIDETGNEIDKVHTMFLLQQIDLLEHNDFITSQAERIRQLYMYMTSEYPSLSFTFKGRIKSLIRAEEKFNGYVIEYIYDGYKKTGHIPDIEELKKKLDGFRDLIAYRIVIQVPKCNIKDDNERRKKELELLYDITNILPDFLSKRGFSIVESSHNKNHSKLLKEDLYPYVRDYVTNPSENGYKSLHLTLHDDIADCYIELQLRTKEMDDFAEIGEANHINYEIKQNEARRRREEIKEGTCIYFDEALEREKLLQDIDLSKVDVNMFGASSNSNMNDGCGLYKGRMITPFEHLSRFQSDK